MASRVNELTNVFKALSDETRLRVLKLLEGGELCVCDIVAGLGMIQPKVSFHLNVLKESGFLHDRKEGRWTHYRLDDSDFFRRSLLLSVLERIPKADFEADRKRLAQFAELRRGKLNLKLIPLKGRDRRSI